MKRRPFNSVRASVLLAVAASALLIVSPVMAQSAETKTYEGEFFPFSLTWDTDVWGSSSSSSFTGNEQIQISVGATVFFVQAFDANGDSERDCIAGAVQSVKATDGVEQLDENDELPLPDNAPSGSSEVLLTYDLTLPGREAPVSFVQYLSCVTMGDDALLLVGVETRAGIYEEELEIIDGLLSGLKIDAS
jgi:hypothetical protein